MVWTGWNKDVKVAGAAVLLGLGLALGLSPALPAVAQTLKTSPTPSSNSPLQLANPAPAVTPAAEPALPQVKTEHVTAELLAEHTSVQPGQTVQIGLRLQHIPHWHTYWRNPGDSGLPTTVNWTLPDGAKVGEINWPAPKRLPIGPLVNYGFEDELLLPLSFTAPANAQPGSSLSLRADATWLVCQDVCIPEEGSLSLQLPVVAEGHGRRARAAGGLVCPHRPAAGPAAHRLAHRAAAGRRRADAGVRARARVCLRCHCRPPPRPWCMSSPTPSR